MKQLKMVAVWFILPFGCLSKSDSAELNWPHLRVQPGDDEQPRSVGRKALLNVESRLTAPDPLPLGATPRFTSSSKPAPFAGLISSATASLTAYCVWRMPR